MTTNRGYGPELNPGTFVSNLTFSAGLDPALFGSVDTSVLLFAGAPVFEGLPIQAVSTPENGTIVYLQRGGVYSVQFRSNNASASPANIGVNVGYLGLPGTGPLVGVPSLADATTKDATIVQGQDAAGNGAAASLSSIVEVSQDEVIKATAGGLLGAPLRLLANGGALDPANTTLQIRRISSAF